MGSHGTDYEEHYILARDIVYILVEVYWDFGRIYGVHFQDRGVSLQATGEKEAGHCVPPKRK
jgi:hypothetical protein